VTLAALLAVIFSVQRFENDDGSLDTSACIQRSIILVIG
jgi:hypothetical protein